MRHAYFLGANDPYSALKTTLKAEIDQEWASAATATFRALSPSPVGRIAVKVINHLGDEVMKVFALGKPQESNPHGFPHRNNFSDSLDRLTGDEQRRSRPRPLTCN